MSSSHARIPALDGLRALAALAVLVFHCGAYFDAPWLAGHGALAVDIFFVMSGVVVERAYGARLAAGWAPSAFAAARVVRLYPLYLLGTLLGLAIQSATARWANPADVMQVLGLFAVAGLLLMPLFTGGGNQVFPLNGPSWSLAIEALLNAAYTLGLSRWSASRVAALAGLAAAVLTGAAALDLPLLQGGRSATLWLDLARGVFGFCVGILICRADAAGRFVRLRGGTTLPVLAAVLVLLAVPRSGQDAWFDPLAILVLGPALVVLTLSSRPSPRLAGWCEHAGALSYPLYVIHAPIVDAVGLRARHGAALVSPEADMLLAGAACLLLAWAVARWVEPVLSRTARRLLRPRERVRLAQR